MYQRLTQCIASAFSPYCKPVIPALHTLQDRNLYALASRCLHFRALRFLHIATRFLHVAMRFGHVTTRL